MSISITMDTNTAGTILGVAFMVFFLILWRAI